ncbi:Plug domain-containing protein [Sphingobium sp. AR-3-1]|uniref:Plug domain-containing protein n=1 Tax=Sphingobium psychrophilum TaxID=2728834 RepID=A0A7X9ZVB7_9SPHN|nr:hypothetical protein [Sphingobium psychrophilum]NML12204.1 Plug domain-containing protein [Sphingobium psychrophilum]
MPVSTTALSVEALEQRSVQDISDVANLASGFRFSQEGGKNQPTPSLRPGPAADRRRGASDRRIFQRRAAVQRRGQHPDVRPGEHPGAKKPLGTFFGRNTIGGAVLINSQQPTFDTEGYIEAGYGRLRQFRLRTGRRDQRATGGRCRRIAHSGTVSKSRRADQEPDARKSGPGRHQPELSFRASLLLKPTENQTNT